MPSFNISTYISAALGIIILILGIAYWRQSYNMDMCEAQASAFRNKTESEGLRSKLIVTGKEKDLKAAILKLQKELQDANTKLGAVYADNERLRKLPQGSLGRGKIVNLADAAPRINCPDARAEFSERLERLDLGVRERILRSRDEAILRTVACKTYVEKITDIINQGNDNAVISD